MFTSKIKIPMIIGIILYGIALLIDLLCVGLQRVLISFQVTVTKEFIIFPFILVSHIAILLMYIIFLILMLKYRGSSRKTAGIIMIVIYSVVNVAYPYLIMLSNQISNATGSALYGTEYIVAKTALEWFIEVTTVPFTVVSSVFVLIAIGRYGISVKEPE